MAFQKKGVKAQQIETVQAQAIVSAVKDLTLDKVVTDLGKTQLSIQRGLADLGAEITSKVTLLENVRQAIILEQQQLESLHSISATATTLDTLQAEMEETRKRWETEKAAQIAEWNDEADAKETERHREEEEYTYTLTQTRRASEDAWKDQLAADKRAEALRRETLEKSWKEREAVLLAAEQELVALRAKAAGFDEAVHKKTEERAKAIKSELEMKFNSDISMSRLEASKDKAVLEGRIAALNETVASLTKQLDTARSDITAANARAESIAKNAFDSVGGRAALSALQHDRQERSDAPSKGR